jgi:hypothetical protein
MMKFLQSRFIDRDVNVLEGDGSHFQEDGDGERGPAEDELPVPTMQNCSIDYILAHFRSTKISCLRFRDGFFIRLKLRCMLYIHT